MSLIVNTNLGSLNAQRSLNSSSTELRTAMERLSSGKRINSAADDAAGFAIAERMNAQIRGLNMAIKNAGDGLAMIETIEASAQTVTDILQRIRELGLQALNGTVSEKDREYIQAEVESLLLEIDRLASDTQFNGEEILHITNRGDKKSIQVGTEAGQTVDFNVLGFDTLWFGGGTSGFALLSDSPALIGPATSPPSSTSDIDFNIVANGESFVIDCKFRIGGGVGADSLLGQ